MIVWEKFYLKKFSKRKGWYYFFIQKFKHDILLIQIYVVDIIFGVINKSVYLSHGIFKTFLILKSTYQRKTPSSIKLNIINSC